MSRFQSVARAESVAARDESRASTARKAATPTFHGTTSKPLSLVALSDAVRQLQADSKIHAEMHSKAEDSHRAVTELLKRIDKIDVRCERLEADYRQMRSGMSKVTGDLQVLRNAQERADVVLRVADDDSRQLRAMQSEHALIKQTVTAADLRAGEQTRMLTDVRSELSALRERHATLASGTAADHVPAVGGLKRAALVCTPRGVSVHRPRRSSARRLRFCTLAGGCCPNDVRAARLGGGRGVAVA